MLDCHTAHVACTFTSINQKMDRRTGAVLEENPAFVKAGDGCMVTLEPTKPLCVETFTEFPPLGRFAIRDMKKTVAVGVIKLVDHEELKIDDHGKHREEKKLDARKQEKSKVLTQSVVHGNKNAHLAQ